VLTIKNFRRDVHRTIREATSLSRPSHFESAVMKIGRNIVFNTVVEAVNIAEVHLCALHGQGTRTYNVSKLNVPRYPYRTQPTEDASTEPIWTGFKLMGQLRPRKIQFATTVYGVLSIDS
jgi:hypothetical protein